MTTVINPAMTLNSGGGSGGGGGGGSTVDTDWLHEAITITATTANPTLGTVTKNLVFWRRIGDSIQLRYDLLQSTGGTAGTGFYLFALPAGANAIAGSTTIDATKCVIWTAPGSCCDSLADGFASDALTYNQVITVHAYDTLHLALCDPRLGTVGSAVDGLNVAQGYSWTVTVPIVEWAT